jgi:hypothetical protein
LTEYRVHGDNIWFNSTSSGGEEIRLILTEHRLIAQARGETENVKAIDQGLKYVLPGRAQFALQRADEARSRHDYRAAAFSFGQAMVIAPSAVPRVVVRALRRDRQQPKAT